MNRNLISGMLAASFVAIFIIPVCYYLVEKIGGKTPPPSSGAVSPEPAANAH